MTGYWQVEFPNPAGEKTAWFIWLLAKNIPQVLPEFAQAWARIIPAIYLMPGFEQGRSQEPHDCHQFRP